MEGTVRMTTTARAKVLDDNSLAFHCPGCSHSHVIRYAGPGAWEWDGSLTLPTIGPSVLVTREAVPDASDEFAEWRTERRCHSFVRSGRIEFLSDSTHSLAGQTVDLPDWETTFKEDQ
jgi:Family of unknown function (DUF6527)